MNNQSLIVLLAVGGLVLYMFTRQPKTPAPTPAGPLTSPPSGTILDRLFPWWQSQRGTTTPPIVVSGVQRDPIGGYISAGGKALSDLVRAVGDVWPRQRRNTPNVSGNTSAPAIVPLTSTGGVYYDWQAFDAFLAGNQGPATPGPWRTGYVFA